MKVIAVVGTKKTGKTTLVTKLVQLLKRHGKVGTIKNMPHHPFEDEGDTKRHFDAGADVVVAARTPTVCECVPCVKWRRLRAMEASVRYASCLHVYGAKHPTI